MGDARTNKGEAGKEEGGRRGEVGEEEAELGPSNQRERKSWVPRSIRAGVGFLFQQ